MNLAPVLDISHFDKGKAIGNRSYGSSVKDVVTYALPFMKKMQKNNIISVVKHFPGHGATSKDSHFVLPKINNIKSLIKNDIKVYEYAIKDGADAIMISHLRLKNYGIKPATLNKKIIDELLINKYNYTGLLVTDDVRMLALRFFGSTKTNIVNSIKAGNNIIMVKYRKNDIKRLYDPIIKKIKNFELDPEIINNSAKKIVNLKNRYKLTNNLIKPSLNVSAINKKIKELNELIDNSNKI